MATERTGVGKHRRICQWQGCRSYANLQDLDTGQHFCTPCAVAMLWAADDPITNWRSFDEIDEYALEFAKRPILGLSGWQTR